MPFRLTRFGSSSGRIALTCEQRLNLLPHTDVELTRGVYDVVFDVGNNGGQMNYSMVRIVDNDSGGELPIFVYEPELNEFVGDLSFGVELTETSRWNPAENEIE